MRATSLRARLLLGILGPIALFKFPARALQFIRDGFSSRIEDPMKLRKKSTVNSQALSTFHTGPRLYPIWLETMMSLTFLNRPEASKISLSSS